MAHTVLEGALLRHYTSTFFYMLGRIMEYSYQTACLPAKTALVCPWASRKTAFSMSPRAPACPQACSAVHLVRATCLQK